MAATQMVTGSEPTSGRVGGAPSAPGGANGADRSKGVVQLTDDQILGIDTSLEPVAAPTRSGASAEEDGGSQRPTATQEQSPRRGEQREAERSREEQSHAIVVEPPEWKTLSDANPELRRVWQAERAYHDVFPTVAEARELKKLFPTLADARAAQENLAELAQIDQRFFSRNSADQAELVAGLAQLDPQAFRGIAQVFPQVLAQVDPEAYRADTALRLEVTLADVRGDATRRGDATLAAAVDLLAERLFGAPENAALLAASARSELKGAATKPGGLAPNLRETEMTRREQALAAREAAAQQQALATFYEDCNAQVVENVLVAIKSQVRELVPEEFPEAARNRVIGEIYREIDAGLRENRQLSEQLRQAFRQGVFDPAHKQAVANLVVGRARHLLPQVAKKVISEWTSSVLSANRQKVEKRRAAATRVDITGRGSPGTVPKQRLTPQEIDYGKLSDLDILNL